MSIIDEMNLEEIETTLSQLRARKRALKLGGKTASRKIATLTRRRDRLQAQLQGIDEQIASLQGELGAVPATTIRRRGRRPKSAIISAAS